MNIKKDYKKDAAPLLFSYVSFPLLLSLIFLRNKTTADVVHFIVQGFFSLGNQALNHAGSYLDMIIQDISTMLEKGFIEIGGNGK
ncbi:hypothetical protein IT6_00950 [Methylacidiphilum caldifontis]|uniref:hypothetical protein n=1 Tax=Methylacidiphilum caldifontis TaxID=2795386 RepID=UPI001A8D7AEB|nr:hypothetical protein [Methylacidiphilum caldifontis]QSR88908.1 hypothetical protein IT6_00950 [Methylacidiphilum caldifontis]